MPYDFEQTHENILKSAKRQFQEKGFRDASIRKICHDAGVTNGAFYAHFESKEDLFAGIVEPCIKGLSGLYADEEEKYLEVGSAEDVVKAFKETGTSLKGFIEYACDHREEFLLILDASAGTKYESFQESLTETEAESMNKFFAATTRFIKNKENLSENVFRLGASFLISTVFDGLRKGLDADDILRETKLVSDFCAAGYQYVLGL